MHFRVALAVLVLGRTWRIDQCGIDDSALAQRQTSATQVAIDHSQDAGSQFLFLQQEAEVEDGGFVRNALQAQSSKLTQNAGLVQRFLHRRVTVAKPVLHQLYTQHISKKLIYLSEYHQIEYSLTP